MKKNILIGIIAIIIVILGIYFLATKNVKPGIVHPSDCADAGEISMNPVTGQFKECCSGLEEIGNFPDRDTIEECEEVFNMEGFGSICTDCGNGNCESWENKCICLEDCV